MPLALIKGAASQHHTKGGGGSWQQGCPRDYLRAKALGVPFGGSFSSKNAKQQGAAFYGSRPTNKLACFLGLLS